MKTDQKPVLSLLTQSFIVYARSKLCTVVKTNSKYKEDDFSDSNAVAVSQDACVHKIHFRYEVHTCNPRSFLSQPHTSITHPSSVRLGQLN